MKALRKVIGFITLKEHDQAIGAIVFQIDVSLYDPLGPYISWLLLQRIRHGVDEIGVPWIC